jgi:ATP-dependent exoDNAse (exonuclease V) beta subunit
MATGSADEIEKRLLYVAMTRARDLAILLPQRFYVHQRLSWGSPRLS